MSRQVDKIVRLWYYIFMVSKTYEQSTDQVVDLLQERAKIVASISDAFDSLPVDSRTIIEHAGIRDKKSLALLVTRRACSKKLALGTWHDRKFGGVIEVAGTLTENNGKKSSIFPMYSITACGPGTDGGYLLPHYEIAMTTDEGDRPVALVMQSILGDRGNPTFSGTHWIDRNFFDSVKQLPVEGLSDLKNTGIYLGPEADKQLLEIHTILELAIARSSAGPKTPMLPLNFLEAA